MNYLRSYTARVTFISKFSLQLQEYNRENINLYDIVKKNKDESCLHTDDDRKSIPFERRP